MQPQKVTVAAIQFAMQADWQPNFKKAVELIRLAAGQGAQIVLLPELFLGEYFCKTEESKFFAHAMRVGQSSIFTDLQALAQELKVVLPVSFFETDGVHYFNSVLMINADGKPLGIYRKSHIPDGPGYEEKFYFKPGNTGFKVWDTAYGKVGVGICWDQWFPEAARAMMLQGAQVLLYPTAIGSEPHNPDLQTKDRWQLAMRGHAVHNLVSVVAANRIGNEAGQTFYGHSFICDAAGARLGS